MNITLYMNKSDKNHVTKNIVSLVTLEGALRNNCSIVTPVIEINDSRAASCNYVYIEDFNRYYYVDNIIVGITGLYTLELQVDVLMSFKEYFTNLSAIVARQENIYNLYLDDDKFLVSAQRMYVTKAFPNRVTPANSPGAKPFIITLAGGEGTSSAPTT